MTQKYTNEELLEDLRQLSEDLGRTPVCEEYNEKGLVTHATLNDRFGSWNNALREAGLEINQEYEIKEDDALLADLRELNERVSHTPPRKRDMDKYGDHGSRTYRLRFGSWNQAVEAAGYSPRPRGDEYQERPKGCPLCGSNEKALDFHHWRYGQNEIGCYLCRECHDKVHKGEANSRNTNWLPNSIELLVERHIHLGEPIDPVHIKERYNLPDVMPIIEMAIEKFQ